MRVRDLMEREFPQLTPRQTVLSALDVLEEWGLPAAPVVTNNQCVGSFVLNRQLVINILKNRREDYVPIVEDLMEVGIPVVHEEQAIVNLFPPGSPMIPVVNNNGQISGILWMHIIANTNIEEFSRRFGVQVVNGFVADQTVTRSQKMLENGIVIESPAMLKVVDFALKVAQVDATVLILGESGVGKEVIAKLIHNSGERFKSGQYIKVNCGAIPRDLLESEFFGYQAGAFTGAKKEGKPGYFELAHRGTLFLDEIGELPLDLQVKFLRVIQERELVRLGDTKPIKVDTRIIAASNKDLHQLVNEGAFREDLYYRLNVLPIYIPPLRYRPEDIPVLLTTFLDKFCRKYGVGKVFSGDSLALLIRYNWPGNVREMENIIERLVITTDEHVILPQHLPLQVYQGVKPSGEKAKPNPDRENEFVYEHEGEMRTLQEVIDEVEKEMIIKALQIYGSTYRAARVLGVSQSNIARKAKKYQQKNERFWREETVD